MWNTKNMWSERVICMEELDEARQLSKCHLSGTVAFMKRKWMMGLLNASLICSTGRLVTMNCASTASKVLIITFWSSRLHGCYLKQSADDKWLCTTSKARCTCTFSWLIFHHADELRKWIHKVRIILCWQSWQPIHTLPFVSFVCSENALWPIRLFHFL